MSTGTLAILAFVSTGFAPDLQEPIGHATVKLPAPLERVLTDYETAWRAKDAKGLAALFTEDGFVLSSGKPPVRGRVSIEAHYKESGGDLSLRAFAFEAEGTIGYIIGGYSRKAGEPDVGKFTLTLKRSKEGRWLIMSDMDNGNRRTGGSSN